MYDARPLSNVGSEVKASKSNHNLVYSFTTHSYNVTSVFIEERPDVAGREGVRRGLWRGGRYATVYYVFVCIADTERGSPWIYNY